MPDIVGPVGRWWDRRNTWQKWALRLLALAVALLAPANSVGRIMAPSSDWKTILFNPIGIYILLALGLNVVVGLAGLLDLGYVAFFAVGAYTFALLAVHHLTFWLLLPIGLVFAALAGLILGAPTLRLRGDYLAIVTLGFGEIVRRVAINSNWMGGPRGVSNIPHPPSIGHIKVVHLRGARPQAVLLPGPGRHRAGHLHRSAPGAKPGRTVLAGDPRGRGRRRGDGRAHLQVQAVGLRHRGVDRRDGRRDLRVEADRHHPRQLPVPALGADPGRGGARRLGQRARASSSAPSWSPGCPSTCEAPASASWWCARSTTSCPAPRTSPISAC